MNNPARLFELRQVQLGQAKTAEDLVKLHGENAATQMDLLAGAHKAVADAAPEDKPRIYGQQLHGLAQSGVDVSQLQQQYPIYPGDQAFEQMGWGIQGLKNQVQNQLEQANIREKTAAAAKSEQETAFYKGLGLAPGVSPEMAGYAAFLQKGGKPEGWVGYKAATEAAARQPYQLQLATAEGQARQLIEGITKPVYVFGQGAQRQLMSATDAIKAGYRTMLPVTEKQVGEDIQLNNRLADVENKVGRYQQSFATDLSFADKNAIAQIIGEDKFKAGLWGTQIPVDFLNKANEAYLHGQLSKQAQDRLIGFYNANESLIGYNRVLSGSARSNEKQLELQTRTLPSPIDNPNFGNNALNQFKENLDFAGQGLPQLPGIKTHQQVRSDLQAETAQRFQQPNQLATSHVRVGQQVSSRTETPSL